MDSARRSSRTSYIPLTPNISTFLGHVEIGKMKLIHPTHVMLGSMYYLGALASNITSFKIDLCPSRMFELVKQTQLPAHEEYPGLRETLGIDLHALQSLQHEWTSRFNWANEQAALNK